MRLSTLVSLVFALTGAHAKPISRRDFSLASYQDATPTERRDFLLAVNASNINLSQDTLDSLKTFPVVEKKMADSGTSELTNDWLKKWIVEFQDEVKQGQESGDADAGLSQVSKRQEEDCGDGEEQETKRGDDDEQDETVAEKRDNDEDEGEARKRDEGDEEGEIFGKRDDDETAEDPGDAEATEGTDEDTSESKRSEDDEEDADSDAVTKRQEDGDVAAELEEQDDETED